MESQNQTSTASQNVAPQGPSMQTFTSPPQQPHKKPWAVVIIIVVSIITIGLGTAYYFLFVNRSVPPPALNQSEIPVGIPSKDQGVTNVATNAANLIDTSSWKTYKNTKYNYMIEFPKEYGAEYYDARYGTSRNALEDEERIGIYIGSNSDDFLEIEIDEFSDNSQTLKSLSEENYKENTTHSGVTNFSPIITSTIDGTSVYEYTFTGRAPRNWGGFIAEARYKVIFAEKDGIVYSIYFTDTTLFNQVFSTFKFL